MGSNRQHVIAFAAMLGLLVGGIAKTEAADHKYEFTKIADSTGPLSTNFSPPAINDKGEVAFSAQFDWGLWGVFTGEGAGTTTIVDGSGPFASFGPPSINSSGVVAAKAFPDTGGVAIVRTDGSTTTTIADQFKGFWILGDHPSVNDDGAVSFLGYDSTGSGIFLGDGTTPTPIAHTPTFWRFGDNPSLNDRGAVAFIAVDAIATGVFRRDGTTTTTIAHTNGPPFSSFGLPFPSLNNENEGAVAFWAMLDAGGSGIFVGNGTTTRTIADSSSSPFLAFGSTPSINDKGVVAFWARHAGGSGIFTGPDPGAHKVIETGDPLFESTVVEIIFGREGLNNAGAVAFVASLRDETGHVYWGVYRADPIPSEDPVPSEVRVSVDIKPGGNPNSINLKSQGTVPVAILTTDDFDATTVDPATVTLAGAPVKLKKNGMLMYAYEDANGDGRVDLVVHMSTQDLQLVESSMVAVLTGKTFGKVDIITGKTLGGVPITGADTVRIVP